MTSAQRPRVFLDVSIGEDPVGRLTIELFTDNAPRTCENFRQLCTGEHDGLSYAKAPFHRVIDEFMVQGGDIAKGDGTGTVSIYGGEFEDENLDWREMDASGLVCSANRGKDTNGSQFFITLEPCEHLNGKHTIFGRIVSGEDTLQIISKVDVNDDDRPLEPVLISRCGELERRKKKASAPAQKVEPARSRDRGRRRGSKGSDVEMSNSPEPSILHKHRRQSDNVNDEGIRGRPRQRSGSRSPPREQSIHEEETEDSERTSPAKKHKRKRSPSPSRQPEGDGNERRRRRSLPNQYHDRRNDRDVNDNEEERFKPSARRDDYRHEAHRRDKVKDDRYRPSRDRNSHVDDDGRLGGAGGYDDYDSKITFKGRGVMKYREPDRQW